MANQDQVSLEVDHLIDQLPKVKAPARPWGKVCIYKVHEKVQAVTNPSAFVPTVISIGPLHHGKEALKYGEECKFYYMSDVLTQNGKNDVQATTALLQKCVEAIANIEERIRDCYAEDIPMKSKEFVDMMVVDGLFLVALFQNSVGKAVTPDDPLAHNPWEKQNLAWDLLLHENQVPMFVLECLYKLTASEDEQKAKTINMLSYDFFKGYINLPRDKTVLANMLQANRDENTQYKHILDQVAQSIHPLSDNTDGEAPELSPLRRGWRKIGKFIIKLILPKPNTVHTSPLYMASATLLNQAGIQFVKGSKDGSFLDISFRDGVFTIPPFGVFARTEPLLRNLMVCEQFSDKEKEYVTSFALLMDRLVVTEKDAEFLSNQGIITNNLGNHKDVSDLISRLKKEIVLGAPFYYMGTFTAVNKYYNNRWHYWRTAIKRKYFSSPWVTIAVFFASILLILTTVKTVIQTLEFYIPKNAHLSSEFNPNVLKLGYY